MSVCPCLYCCLLPQGELEPADLWHFFHDEADSFLVEFRKRRRRIFICNNGIPGSLPGVVRGCPRGRCHRSYFLRRCRDCLRHGASRGRIRFLLLPSRVLPLDIHRRPNRRSLALLGTGGGSTVSTVATTTTSSSSHRRWMVFLGLHTPGRVSLGHGRSRYRPELPDRAFGVPLVSNGGGGGEGRPDLGGNFLAGFPAATRPPPPRSGLGTLAGGSVFLPIGSLAIYRAVINQLAPRAASGTGSSAHPAGRMASVLFFLLAMAVAIVVAIDRSDVDGVAVFIRYGHCWWW